MIDEWRAHIDLLLDTLDADGEPLPLAYVHESACCTANTRTTSTRPCTISNSPTPTSARPAAPHAQLTYYTLAIVHIHPRSAGPGSPATRPGAHRHLGVVAYTGHPNTTGRSTRQSAACTSGQVTCTAPSTTCDRRDLLRAARLHARQPRLRRLDGAASAPACLAHGLGELVDELGAHLGLGPCTSRLPAVVDLEAPGPCGSRCRCTTSRAFPARTFSDACLDRRSSTIPARFSKRPVRLDRIEPERPCCATLPPHWTVTPTRRPTTWPTRPGVGERWTVLRVGGHILPLGCTVRWPSR